MNCNEFSDRIGQDLHAVVEKETPERPEGNISEIIRIIGTMPPPPRRVQERSVLFKACFTIYNGLVAGVMCAVSYLFFFSGFFSFEQITLLPEARSAFFGTLSIIIGCVCILLKGRDLNNWFVARIWKNAASFQLAADSAVMLLAGAGFCVYGSVMFLTGIL